ncbi:UDP-N-acetylglucosamine 2-epimerase (non-hydrolyzing) [candidate division WOR-3 bacterium]|nr:UDP-N-acetylglucosamine 2-epimerase (non-hydrolyzing) [candidate division WOR-3 bacterium]
MKKITIVSGTRPNLVKIAPLIKRYNDSFKDLFRIQLIHTGQHYDHSMHGAILEDFSLPLPDIAFEIQDKSPTSQIAEVMTRLEKVFKLSLPDAVIAVGDVNSTLATAVTSSKMGLYLIHLEAGVRSFDMSMPEEQNRVVVDSLSDLHLAPTGTAVTNLKNQGIRKGSIIHVGNILAESLTHVKDKPTERENFGLMTLHRPFNVDNPDKLLHTLSAVSENAGCPVYFPVHPRTMNNLKSIKVPDEIRVCEPLTYSKFIAKLSKCSFVLTDSGGVQTEATILKTPCVTLRENSEWPETIDFGTNTLLRDPHKLKSALKSSFEKTEHSNLPVYWDSDVSLRVWQSAVSALGI